MSTPRRMSSGLLLAMILALAAGALEAQVNPWAVIERSLRAELASGTHEAGVERQEFFLAAPRLTPVSRVPGTEVSVPHPVPREFQASAEMKTSDVLTRGILERKLSFTFRTEQKEDGPVRFMQLLSVEPYPAPGEAEKGGEPRGVEVSTITAEALFKGLEPEWTRLEVLREAEREITLKVESLRLQELTRSPLYLKATFDRSTGLLRQSELLAYGLPIAVTSFEYETVAGRTFPSRRVMRVNSSEGVRVSVDRFAPKELSQPEER